METPKYLSKEWFLKFHGIYCEETKGHTDTSTIYDRHIVDEYNLFIKDGEDEQMIQSTDKLRWRLWVQLYNTSRESNGYAETIDAIREVLGQDATHFLVMADDVDVLVKMLIKFGKNDGFRKEISAMFESIHSKYVDPYWEPPSTDTSATTK